MSAVQAQARDRRIGDGDDLVSIVIPCHNQAHFLAEAIESALAQTHPAVEVVVVDDGSTDATVAVAGRYPGVRCVSQPRGGLSAARNAGLRESRGAYLIFLDADDRLLPHAAAAGLAALRDHPDAAAAVGHYRTIDADGTVLREWPWEPPDPDAYRALLRSNYVGMHATVLYRRWALEEIGGFTVGLAACEDYDVLLRIARRHPIRNHGVLVAEYRRHGGGMSGDPALMLRTVRQVHNAQWPVARTRPDYRRAFAQGQRFWRALYGRQIVTRVAGGPGGLPDARRLGRDLLLLARYYPRGVASAVGKIVLETLRVAPLYRRVRSVGRALERRLLPGRRRRRLHARGAAPPPGAVNFGALRRLTPISRTFGFDRGRPVDRYYIERFLARHAGLIKGRVLEVGDASYTRRFGGDRVAVSDVLHVTPGHPQATIVADLARADHVPSDAFDCIILTQTLHLIYDVRAAVRTLHRILKPGGTALVTVPGISPLSHDEWAATWYWAFTALSAQRVFAEVFDAREVDVETFGNVLAAAAFLYGVAAEELTAGELDHHDPHFPVTVAVRARKADAQR